MAMAFEPTQKSTAQMIREQGFNIVTEEQIH